MRLRYPLLLALLALVLAPLASAQSALGNPLSGVLINEVDADQTSTDNAEFVELYNSTAAGIDLSTGVLVFFNGSDDASYNAVDLDGFTIPAGGYFVFCGDAATVANCDLEVGAGTTNLIQNGADAVALYVGAAADFPGDTPATTTNLVDALVYGTGDSTDDALLAALGETVQYDEDANGEKDTESTQRSPDGAEAYLAATPTPGAANALPSEAFAGVLLGANEVPAVDTQAGGFVEVSLTGNDLAITGSFAGLESDYAASHLHRAPAGGNGPVVVALSPTVDADNRGGTFSETVTLSETDANALRAGEIYVNVHSADNAGGELRAQLEASPATPTVTLLQARNVGPGATVTVSGTVSRAMGDFTYLQDATGGLALRQTFGTFRDDVTAGTIAAGSTLEVTGELSEFGSLLQISNEDLTGYSVTGSTDVPDAQEISFADLAANGEAYEGELVVVEGVSFAETGTFANGTTYTGNDGTADGDVRVDGDEETAVGGVAIPVVADVTGVVSQRDFGDGTAEYRVLPILADDVVPGTEEFAGYLLGANEEPAVETGAAGAVVAELVGTELSLFGRFAGLEGDYAASHLHQGAAGSNGDVLVALDPTVNADSRSGTFDETITLTEAQAALLRAGEVYVNVHSAAFPSGELRAQLVMDPAVQQVTLLQARYIGSGFPVAVTGTVTRAMGDFTWMQDASGGIVIRQTSGAFQEDVADGTIAPGTTLEVSGELSEFRALLQINNDDLEGYVVTGTTAVPDAQQVTLLDLESNGEAYESELVFVRGLTFADAGETFAAGTNYNADDGSGGAAQIRVIGADDTEVDGLAIPPANANVTGVVGQFDREAPFTDGYQLQPILAADVEVATANEEGVLRTGARLAVENPARGAVSVRFDVGVAGAATVTVFDAVGRRVAVLADGEMAAGEQAATLDAAALASGVYIVRLEVASGALTRVVTVVR